MLKKNKKLYIVLFIAKKLVTLVILFFFSNCNKPVPAQKPVQTLKNGQRELSQKTGKLLLENETNAIQEAIKTKFKNEKFKKTQLAFWISESIEEKEINKMGDLITYTYEVYNLNKQLIYSFSEIGTKTLALEKQNEIRGIEYALKIMKEEEEAYLLLPSFLAYAGYGDKNKIKPNTPIAIKLKIIKINKQ